MLSTLQDHRFLGALLSALVLVASVAARANPIEPLAHPAPPAPNLFVADASKPADPAAAAPSDSLALTMTSRMQSVAGHVVQGARHITDSALELIGVRYKFGGQSPERGMDCSGFVRYVFEQVTGTALPHSAREQAKVGEIVTMDKLEPGDLVFFNTRKHAFSHVGIYLGDNSFIHSPNKRGSIQVTNIDGRYWKARFNGARRLLGVMPGMVSMGAAKAVLQSLPNVTRSDAPPDE